MSGYEYIDYELSDAIEDLVADGHFDEDSKEYGISQQVIRQGYDSLSPKQRYLYDSVVGPALSKRGEEIRIIQIMNSAED